MWKTFPGTVANHDVDLTVAHGTIHSLVGENGAGKSTLVKTIYGMHRPDRGSLAVNGHGVSFKSPADAIALGIGMVHQHFMLADHLSVTENIMIGAEPRRPGLGRWLGIIDHERARDRVRELASRLGVGIEPDAAVGDLGVGMRQRVEIAKVLYRGARIIILDEPTAVLVPEETRELFANLRALATDGFTILFISHKLDEVLTISDDITVMRAGTTVTTLRARDTSAEALGRLIIGEELPTPAARPKAPTSEAVLSVDRLSTLGGESECGLDDVSLTVHTGEIVGIAGVEGNGQQELCEAILGLRASDGHISLSGTDLGPISPTGRRLAGISYVPFDRQRHGLLLDEPIWINTPLGHQRDPRFGRGTWFSKQRARSFTSTVTADFSVMPRRPDLSVSALSGGNQQKLIVGREINSDPKLLIAAHPTRGVDIGAQSLIADRLRASRDRGLAVLFISADLDELIELADRIDVMFEGRVVASLAPADADAETLGLLMTGGERVTPPSVNTVEPDVADGARR